MVRQRPAELLVQRVQQHDGVARNPAAPTSATKATAATSQAGCRRRFFVTRTSLGAGRIGATSGRKAIMRNNRAMTVRPHRIAVLALDQVVGLDLGTPAQVFSAARAADEHAPLRRPGVHPGRAAGAQHRRLPGAPRPRAGVARHRRHGDRPGHPRRPALTRRHRRAGGGRGAARGARAGAPGSCRSAPARSCWPPPACSTGAGPPPTGRTRERFRRLHRRVDLDPDVLFIDDGGCSPRPASAAGIDLCLHVIRLDHGSEVANRAARRCVVPPWRDGGQAQYIERPVPEGHRHQHRERRASGRGSGCTSRSRCATWPSTRG